jgi:hypothetical protein
MMPERRIKRLHVTPDCLLFLAKRLDGLTYVEIEGIPDDAHAVGATHDIGRDQIVILVESAEFAPVAEGDPVPDLITALLIPPGRRRHE